MIHTARAIHEIRTGSIFQILLKDLIESCQIKNPGPFELEKAFEANLDFQEEYRRLNRENGVSSIHYGSIPVEHSNSPEKESFTTNYNSILNQMKSLEKYEQGASGNLSFVWIGSVAIGIIFMIHNIISLFLRDEDLYAKMGNWIYFTYGLIILSGFALILRSNRSHERNRKLFQSLATEMEQLVQIGLEKNYFSETELFSPVPGLAPSDVSSSIN